MSEKQMINLTTIKTGDTVYFRCGGKAIVASSELKEGTDYIELYFSHDTAQEKTLYFVWGTYAFAKGHPFDIIRVDPVSLN